MLPILKVSLHIIVLLSIMDARPNGNPSSSQESTSTSSSWASKFKSKDGQTYKNSHVPVLPFQGETNWGKKVTVRLEIDGNAEQNGFKVLGDPLNWNLKVTIRFLKGGRIYLHFHFKKSNSR
jgi:hypothetical protein